MQHAEIAPSSSPEWVYCAASVPAQAGLKQDDESAAEGTALHEVARMHFMGEFKSYKEVEGTEVEGVLITWEMIMRVDLYITLLNSLRTINSQVEKRVDISIIHPKCFGTPDFWDYDNNTLTIADYKDGFIEVESIDNWQLLCYIFGIVDKYLRAVQDTLNIRVLICQPRSYLGDKIKEWKCTYKEIKHHLYTLQQAALAVYAKEPREKAGLHCRHCLAKFNCASFTLTCHNLAVAVAYNTMETPEDLTCELEFVDYAEKMIKWRKQVLEAEALAKLQRGETVRRFQIGKGRGNLAWNDDLELLDSALNLYGVNIYKDPQRLTPTQAKTELKKAGLPTEALDMFTTYYPGSPKLTPVNQRYFQELFKEK